MQPVIRHSWDLSETAAEALQCELASRVVTTDRVQFQWKSVAGADVAYDERSLQTFAAVAVLEAGSLQVIKIASAKGRCSSRYVPGLLSFRELPTIALALEKLDIAPDLIICDGHGIAHPKRFGLASHLGVLYDIPTIGCAKNHLVGESSFVGLRRGDRAELTYKGDVVGAVLRTQDDVKPLYVSPGHRVSLNTACELILSMSRRYRQPEPIRVADQTVRRLKKDPNE
jgi:deoxyribonuclease V